MSFRAKAEFEIANGTLEGLADQWIGGLLELLAEVGDATVLARACTGGDSWHETEKHWFCLHAVPRHARFVPPGKDQTC